MPVGQFCDAGFTDIAFHAARSQRVVPLGLSPARCIVCKKVRANGAGTGVARVGLVPLTHRQGLGEKYCVGVIKSHDVKGRDFGPHGGETGLVLLRRSGR